MGWLEAIANIASILTALAAVSAWLYVVWGKFKRKCDLECYLKAVKGAATGAEKGRRTIMHVSGKLKMTEDQVLQAAFSNPRITCTLGTNKETGRADCLYLEFGSSDRGPDGD